MNNSINSNWHKESYDRFIHETLPALLAERLPFTNYGISRKDTFTCTLLVSIADVQLQYDLLQPDNDGLFQIDGKPYVVVPVASSAHLDKAEVKCVGEQLFDYIESHLGEATSGLPWDESLVRAWLPLDIWVRQVITSSTGELTPFGPTGQPLDTTNAAAARTHRRRILIANVEDVVTPSQFGRVCPLEVPEGPNIGRVFSLAVGAAIRNGRIEIVDERPEAALGFVASMVPFLECNDPNRQTFGVNMMRQWMVPTNPEPALVQTGNEPEEPGIWCGKNLLTAFISWGQETFEDGILISESCAIRLSDGLVNQVQTGDKISNRHGSKGVISRIVPDSEMPHLQDGTPIELVYSFIGLHSRQNFGQIREAVVGRIASAEGEPAIIRPFHSLTDDELRERLAKAQLPVDCMEFLTIGQDGKKLERPSTVGYVYWGRTVHTSSSKIHACVSGSNCNIQGELEYYALRDIGCFATIQSHFNTCSNNRSDREDFVRAVETGPVEQSKSPAPQFASLLDRLSTAGIQAELTDSGLSFQLAPPSGERLKLAQAVPHPWAAGNVLSEIGMMADVPHYGAVVDANAALSRAIAGNAPESLKKKALADLESRVDALFTALVKNDCDDPVNAFFSGHPPPIDLHFQSPVMFSGRAVLAPGLDLHLDEVGLAEEIAWTIFGPLVTRELGDKQQVENRTDEAAKVLDNIMARSWIILDRAPVLIHTALMAFRPKRIPEPVIRLHPLACFLMNADFDGDQAAVFLPITDDAQREAAEKLSLAGHLTRDPNLYGLRLITQEALWGLAELSLKPGGLDEIKEIFEVDFLVTAPIDRDAAAQIVRRRMERDGVPAAIELMEKLTNLGLSIARESGASMSPFIGSCIERPPAPESDAPEAWNAYLENVIDTLESRTDYESPDIGPQLLAIKSGSRGTMLPLVRLTGPSRIVKDAQGHDMPIRHGFRDGFTPEEAYACVAGARRGLAALSNDMITSGYGVRGSHWPKGFGVLARAMRASNSGEVFARAAATKEIDPLTDIDSRLFVGLPPL